MSHGRSNKLFIFGVISVAATCITAVLITPATGYEPSIYSATPLPFWIFLVGAYLTGILLLAPLPPYLNHDFRGLLLVIGSYALLFTLPVFRGYEMLGRGGGDSLAHVGYTKILMDSGIGSNWYPFLHGLLAVIKHVTGASWQATLSLTATVFITAFVVGTSLLLRRRSGDSLRFYTTAIAAAPLTLGIFTRSTQPAMYSFFLAPFALLVVQLPDKKAKIATIIFTLTIVTAHPVTVALLLLIIGIGWIWQPWESRSSLSAGWTLIIGVSAFTWYSSFDRFSRIVRSIFGLVDKGAAAESKIDAAASYPLEYVVRRGMEMYGSAFIIFGLAGFAGAILVYRYYRGGDNVLTLEISTHYLVAVLVAGVFLFAPLIVGSPLRASRYLVFASVLLIGLAYPLSTGRRGDLARGFCVALILFSAVLSVGAVYEPNKHLTEGEMQGSDWYLDHRSTDLDARSHKITYKTQLYLDGRNDWVFSEVTDVPDRLGQQDGTIQDNLNSGTYLITRQSDRQSYTWFPKNQWDSRIVYTDENVHSLRSDSVVELVYTNGQYEVWVRQ